MSSVSAGRQEARFLSGRHSLPTEIRGYLRVCRELFLGFRAFHGLGPAVAVFGSARFGEEHRYYALARRIGALLARDGYVVMTGAGPGIMEAANRGARESGGMSVGCHILLPREHAPNRYLDRVARFSFLFARKLILLKYAYAFIILPGGFGTLDELTEAVTLVQAGKLYDFPVILIGREYWQGLYDWLEKTVAPSGAVDAQALHALYCADTPEEAMAIVRKTATGLGLKLQPLEPRAD